MAMNDELHLGLYEKFYVTRNDGSTDPGGRHEHCEHFVLDLTHDAAARAAARCYADLIEIDNALLASELRQLVRAAEEAHAGQPCATVGCPGRVHGAGARCSDCVGR